LWLTGSTDSSWRSSSEVVLDDSQSITTVLPAPTILSSDASCNVREDAGGGDIIDSHRFCGEIVEKENT